MTTRSSVLKKNHIGPRSAGGGGHEKQVLVALKIILFLGGRQYASLFRPPFKREYFKTTSTCFSVAFVP